MPDLTAAGVGPDRASSLQAQLRRGFPSMQFDRALESAYRDDEFRNRVGYLRINLAILFILVLAILQIDRIVIPSFSHAVPIVARTGVMLPILIIAFALSFLRGASVWYAPIMTVLMTLAMMGIAWIGLFAWTQGEDRVFVRLVIATVAVYFVMGLRFRLALAANLAAIAFYAIAAIAAWAMPPLVLTHALAMLLMTSVICAAGAYNLEHARRTAWLEGLLLEEFALRDGLTGIHNRRRLDEHLQQIWQHAQRERRPVALLFSDIDAFKAYNDRYGHQAGDEALKAVAAVHARYGTRALDMAARFGGEEFAVILFDTRPDQALYVAEQIMQDVRALGIGHTRSDAAPVLTTSIGIACVVPEEAQGCGTLLQLADRALYCAKNAGRNRAHLLG